MSMAENGKTEESAKVRKEGWRALKYWRFSEQRLTNCFKLCCCYSAREVSCNMS